MFQKIREKLDNHNHIIPFLKYAPDALYMTGETHRSCFVLEPFLPLRVNQKSHVSPLLLPWENLVHYKARPLHESLITSLILIITTPAYSYYPTPVLCVPADLHEHLREVRGVLWPEDIIIHCIRYNRKLCQRRQKW